MKNRLLYRFFLIVLVILHLCCFNLPAFSEDLPEETLDSIEVSTNEEEPPAPDPAADPDPVPVTDPESVPVTDRDSDPLTDPDPAPVSEPNPEQETGPAGDQENGEPADDPTEEKAEDDDTPETPEQPADEDQNPSDGTPETEDQSEQTVELTPGLAQEDEEALTARANYRKLSASTSVRSTGTSVGSTITWTITPSGGNGDYAYFYNIFCGNEVVKYGDWQLSPSISWTTTKAGNYFVAAYVVDSRWTEIEQSPDGGLFTIVSGLSPLRASLVADKMSAGVGETITWTITPSGGNGDYAYFYNIFCGNDVVKYGDWQLNPSISWTPSKSGNYYVAGYVVDSRWAEISQAPEGGLCIVNPPVSGAYVKADKTTVNSGDVVTWTAGASGGNGSYLYNFVIYNGKNYVGESGWQVENSYSAFLVTPGSVTATVYITDTTWAVTAVGYQKTATTVKKIRLSIPAEYTYIDNTSPVSGDEIYLDVFAIGGTGEYAYQYTCYEYDEEDKTYHYSWNTDWGNESCCFITFYGTCTISVACEVIDSAGESASYVFPTIHCRAQ